MGEFTENEINARSTSDKRKRRMAHVTKFCQPVERSQITSGIATESESKSVPEMKQIVPYTYNNSTFVRVKPSVLIILKL